MRASFIAYALIGFLTLCFLQPILADEPLKSDVIVARSKSAVFKILAGAEVDTDYPKVKLRLKPDPRCEGVLIPFECFSRPSVLHLDYESDRALLRTDYPELAYSWFKIASDPARYLDADETPCNIRDFSWPRTGCRHLEHQDSPYASGSGFAVSEEGIFLTNAHVVLPPSDLKRRFLVLPVEQALAELKEGLGGAPPQDKEFLGSLRNALADWLQTKGTFTLKRGQIRVIMKTSPSRLYWSDISDFSDLLRGPRGLSPSRHLGDWRTYSVPAEVLTSGAPGTASDVAVLRLERSVSLGRSVNTRELLSHYRRQRFMCLPLGDSDEVHNPIHAMGFPGRVSEALEENPAVPQVIVHPGEARRIIGLGGSLLHMSAAISEGDSGGPVVDSYGGVVGLTVARVEGDTFAIPINTAKKMLADKGIKPSVGEESIHWFAAQAAFDQERYSGAYRELEAITDPVDPKLLSSESDANVAIADLAKVCQERIKEGRDKSGLLDKAWYKWKY